PARSAVKARGPPPFRRRALDPAEAGSCPSAPGCWAFLGRSSNCLRVGNGRGFRRTAEMASNRFGDAVFDSGAVASDPAVSPLDPAIVGGKIGFGHQYEAAGIAALF